MTENEEKYPKIREAIGIGIVVIKVEDIGPSGPDESRPRYLVKVNGPKGERIFYCHSIEVLRGYLNGLYDAWRVKGPIMELEALLALAE